MSLRCRLVFAQRVADKIVPWKSAYCFQMDLETITIVFKVEPNWFPLSAHIPKARPINSRQAIIHSYMSALPSYSNILFI